VTRVNLGVQSFDAAMLTGAGRAHTTADVAAALAAVRSSGVRSWGLDLISGLPHLTRATWAATLDAAVAAAPQHVSVYDLQVEAGTAFGRWYTPGAQPLPSDDDGADMYRMASSRLSDAGCAADLRCMAMHVLATCADATLPGMSTTR
jgi:coproporphyrinogen III oxidase-like Fe-S oxidoreductase